MRGFLSNSLISIFIKVANVLLGFLTTVYLTNNLEVETFGEYSFWIAVVTLLALPLQIGFPTVFMRETAKGCYHQVARKYKEFSILIFLVISLSCALSIYFEMKILALSLCIAYLISVSTSISGAIRGNGYYLLGQVPDNLLRQVLFLIICISAYFFSLSKRAEDYLMIMLVASLLSTVFTFFLLKRIKITSENKSKDVNISASLIYFTFLAGIQVVNGQVDIFAISFYEGQEDVALYRVALQISLLVSFGLHAVTMYASPLFSKLYYANKIEELISLIEKSILLSVIISLPCLLFITFFGEILLSKIFGFEYIYAYYALIFLAIGQFLGSLFGPQVTILNSCGFEKDVFRITSYSVLINVILNLILVPFFSIEGAAVATCLSQMFRIYALSIIIKNNIDFKFGIRRLVYK